MTNKKHRRKLFRVCPMCGKKPYIGHHSLFWWIYCTDNYGKLPNEHIPQKLFQTAQEAIDNWNKGEDV